MPYKENQMDNPLKILVVEDSLVAQGAVNNQLSALGCIVDLASDGQGAITKCNNSRYHAILMDLGLYPGINGFEVTKLIRANSMLNKNTMIIAHSIHDESYFYTQIKEADISHFIPKPLTYNEAEELVRFINESLDTSEK